MTAETIDVATAVDNQKLRPFHFAIVAVLAMVAITDGFDLQAAALAATGIAADWGMTRAALTPILTAGFVGILFGAPIMGWLGDRAGRKPVITAGCMIFGLASAASAYAPDVTTLTLLRFITGIGLGGVLPNAFALTAELSPGRQRAFFTSMVALGIILGSASVAMLSAAIGIGAWRHLFLVGGAAGIGAAALVMLLPESPLFLAASGKQEKLARLMRKIAPDAPAASTFVAHKSESAKPSLFADGFQAVTPLIWIIYVCALLALFFITSWAPVVLSAEGVPPARAAFIVSLFQIGGIGGSIAVSFLLHRFRYRLVAALLGLAVCGVLVVAFIKLGENQLAIAVAFCGFAVLGAQTAVNAGTSLLYPSALRARGVGWGLGVGRIGSIGGALLGGALAAIGALSAQRLFLAPAVPLAIAFIAALFVAMWERRRKG